VRTSEVRYARVDDDHVAYRVIEGTRAGDRDVVLIGSGTMSMEAFFDDVVARRVLEGLSDLGRLIVFDRRGIGLSDPPTTREGFGSERWCRDIEAVVDAVQAQRPVLVGSMGSLAPALVFCDRNSSEVSAAVILEPAWGRFDRAAIDRQISGEVDSITWIAPSRADEPGFREWFVRAGQAGASPSAAARSYLIPGDDELLALEQAAARMSVPFLVLRRPAAAFSPPRDEDPVVALVRGSERLELPGGDLAMFGGEADAVLAEINRFVTGEHRIPEAERVLAAILFSDVVGSTERASEMGDTHWARVLDRHDAVARSCVGRRGGTVVKSTGDGVMATFSSARDAVQAGIDLVGAVDDVGLAIRVGIHAGDVDRRGDDLSGIAVHIAARVGAAAGSGEVLVSETVPRLVSGVPFTFVDRGQHALKGVPEPWHLFAVVP
jgi:class 3 adenylate cyclase/alpha-beta hydrolase superfamily lysophospholipase